MSTHQETTTTKRSLTTTAGFSLTDRKIQCAHNFQIYCDYGNTPKGPWVKIGINDTEYGIGFLPQEKPNLSAVPNAEPLTT